MACSGDAPGQFNNPYGVDVDSNGLIYVSDSQNSRIQVFTASGAYIYSFGQSIMPIKLKIHNNKAYVADSQNDCIMIYDIPKSQTTTHTVATGNVGIGTSSPTEKLEVDGNVKINNNLILANGASSVSQTILKAMSQSEARTITLPDTSGIVVVTDDGNITIPDGSVTTAKLADASVTAAKLAGNPGNGTSGKVLVSNGDGTFDWEDASGAFTTQGSGSASLDYSFGSSGSEPGQFNYPQDIAFDSNDNIYVADGNNARIQVFTSSGDYSYSIDTGTNGILYPASIAIDSNDNVYVTGSKHVRVFTAQGNFSYSFGGAGTQDGKFSSTQGIAVDNDGKVYVSDNGRIQVFENQGEFSYKFSNDDFKRPRKIAFDNGKIYVADPDNHRIKIFTADGTLIDSIGYGSTDSEGNGSNNGTAPGSLDRPLGVDVDSNGLIYVADTNHSRIQVFTASGEYSYSISGVSGPYSVRVHNNKIYAVDSSYCIMIFDPPTPKTHTVSSGNVGIGTSSPTEKLEVDGNVKINNNLILANGASSVSQTILKAMSQSEARTITLPDTSGVVVVTDDGNITIPDGSVTTAKLADASVTAAKLAGNPGTPDLGPNAFSGLMSS